MVLYQSIGCCTTIVFRYKKTHAKFGKDRSIDIKVLLNIRAYYFSRFKLQSGPDRPASNTTLIQKPSHFNNADTKTKIHTQKDLSNELDRAPSRNGCGTYSANWLVWTAAPKLQKVTSFGSTLSASQSPGSFQCSGWAVGGKPRRGWNRWVVKGVGSQSWGWWCCRMQSALRMVSFELGLLLLGVLGKWVLGRFGVTVFGVGPVEIMVSKCFLSKIIKTSFVYE